ncbi:MAG: hypothetical protein JW944_08175 [Deltaproteobacteria bacterium]|nr:hypothetical protein [Deltaproteobacteria bacterium]
MNSKDIIERIEEFRKTRPDAGCDNTRLLEAALFVEDAFGLCLNDDEICEKNLGTHQAMEGFVQNKIKAI